MCVSPSPKIQFWTYTPKAYQLPKNMLHPTMATSTEFLAIIMVAVPKASSTSEATTQRQTERRQQLLRSENHRTCNLSVLGCLTARSATHKMSIYLLLMLQPKYPVLDTSRLSPNKGRLWYSHLTFGEKTCSSSAFNPIPLILKTPKWYHICVKPLQNHGFWGVFDIRWKEIYFFTTSASVLHLFWWCYFYIFIRVCFNQGAIASDRGHLTSRPLSPGSCVFAADGTSYLRRRLGCMGVPWRVQTFPTKSWRRLCHVLLVPDAKNSHAAVPPITPCGRLDGPGQAAVWRDPSAAIWSLVEVVLCQKTSCQRFSWSATSTPNPSLLNGQRSPSCRAHLTGTACPNCRHAIKNSGDIFIYIYIYTVYSIYIYMMLPNLFGQRFDSKNLEVFLFTFSEIWLGVDPVPGRKK